MQKKEIIVPAAGESVTEADIADWYKADGDFVEMDEPIVELETDKASMDLTAEISGILHITVEDGTVKVGDVLGYIEESAEKSAGSSDSKSDSDSSKKEESSSASDEEASSKSDSYASGHASPAAAKLAAEKNVDVASLNGSGKDGRVTKDDVQQASAKGQKSESKEQKSKDSTAKATQQPVAPSVPGARQERTQPMSRMRRTIAKRLVDAQQNAALLTTFNEVDLTEVMAIRSKYKDKFKEKYEVGLGFMSFFTKAAAVALQEHPVMNAQVKNDEIIFHDYCDIGIAVATPKGLVVPVVRNAESKTFSEIEQDILNYALKGRSGKLTLADMEGGTFSITNGGVFGSMMSTPIINAPQSAILGMHNIVKRPMVVDNEIKIRPMMYLAVTYDHRIIDGSDAVRFLVKIKELLEDPTRLLIGL